MLLKVGCFTEMLQIFFMKFIREIFFPINTKKYDVKYYKILDDAGFVVKKLQT